MTTVGFELEVSRGAREVAALLANEGRISDPEHHHYHCTCTTCAYDYRGNDGRVLFALQEDCTANGEFISKVLTYGTDEVDTAATTLSSALIAAGAEVRGDVGLHVHVARPALGDRRHATDTRVARIFLRYQDELRELAAGARPEVRGYNHPTHLTHGTDARAWWAAPLTRLLPGPWTGTENRPIDFLRGSWLAWDSRTYEFRLWNAPLSAWRIRLAVGLSHAVVEAARNRVNVYQNDPRPVEEVLAPYMDAATWAGVLTQRRYKGGVDSLVNNLTLEVGNA